MLAQALALILSLPGARAPAQTTDSALRDALAALSSGTPDDAAWRRLSAAWESEDREFDARARWDLTRVRAYCDAALYLTDVYAPPGALSRPPEEALERAAQLAREHRELRFGPELEGILAESAHLRGDSRAVLTRLERALEVYADAGRARLPLLRLKAGAETDLGLLSAAGRTLEAALALCDAERDEPGFDSAQRGFVESMYVQWLLHMGLPDHAARALARERQSFASGTDERGAVQLAFDENYLDLATESFSTLLERSARCLADPSFEPFQGDLLDFSARAAAELAYEQPEMLAVAADHARAGIERLDATDPYRVGLRALLAALELRRGDLAAARAQVLAADRERSDSESAKGAVELAVARARLFRASGAPREQLESSLNELATRFSGLLLEWWNAPERSDGLGFLAYGERRALLCEQVALELQLEGPERAAQLAFGRLAEVHASGSLWRRSGGGAVSPTELRRTLCGARRGLLILIPGPDSSFVVALDESRAIAVAVPAWRTWRPAQRAWSSLLGQPPRGPGAELRRTRLAELGQRLSEVVLPPEVAALLEGWDELSIVGWEWTGYLPFEPLPWGQASFGERFAVAYLPSLPLGARIAAKPPVARRGLRVLAAPSTPPAALARGWKWAPIRWHEARAERLRALWDDVALSTGDDAAFPALRGALNGQGAALEVMAHGFYDSERVPPAGFALAVSSDHDGLVRAVDLRGLAAPPLVVLAVCGAARGPLRSGDHGVSHLGGAFLEAGAECVALAVADLEQEPAERLVDELYRGVTERGLAPAVALRDARRTLRESDPFERDLLHLVGFGFRPLNVTAPAPSGSRAAQLAGGALALALVAVLALRRARS